ncbi:MAG: hydroxylamine reductase [Candidatus Eremiobacteraeota bacterium]|nr:hydroxylamine reductase [Candidatus Eremiobacteraeota bacterium]
MNMFCFQCQETLKNTGCVMAGICGKSADVATLQDLLIYLLKGISVYGEKARKLGHNDEEVDIFVARGLFTTITNVNFDTDRLVKLIEQAFKAREKIENIFLNAYKEKHGEDFTGKLPEPARWKSGDGIRSYLEKGRNVGVLAEKNEDIRSLKQLLTYGLKGIAAYADHAYILGKKDDSIFAFLQEALEATTREFITVDELVNLVIKAGEMGVTTMALLDEANTSRYGNPEPTEVYTGTRAKPAILISGHDLLDMEEILQQTAGKGVDIYTHGEMLPANAYPAFKKYDHFVGNYGTSWFNQQKEFDKFNGAIIMTTNCIQKPKESYKNRIFTTGLVAWPDVAHISDREFGKPKDFSLVIEKALEQGALEEIPGKKIMIGFARNSLMASADKIISAVKSGKIKRFVVMAGCDGRYKNREYYTEVAKNLPEGTVILTAGCAKYRYNMLDLGDIDGIPRVIDAGQCNDSYSLAYIALQLVKAFEADSINDLPISFDIAWYEQKAVTVLLALLYLGVKGIRLGPTLPAFLSPNVAKVLVEKFDIKLIGTVEEDIDAMMLGK